MILNEVSRNQLIAQSKSNPRYQRRTKSNIGTASNEYNKIDMDKLFKEDILEANIPVKGETNNYVVMISFEGVIEELKEEVKRNKNNFELRNCVQALQRAFNKNDIFGHCNCPDATYRMNYWQTVKRIISKDPETRPSKITNPDDTLGSGCKHFLLILSKTLWILKISSVLYNYTRYMERTQKKLYDKLIAPKIFEELPEEPLEDQISMFDDEEEVEEQDAEEKAIKDEPEEEVEKEKEIEVEVEPIEEPKEEPEEEIEVEVEPLESDSKSKQKINK